VIFSLFTRKKKSCSGPFRIILGEEFGAPKLGKRLLSNPVRPLPHYWRTAAFLVLRLDKIRRSLEVGWRVNLEGLDTGRCGSCQPTTREQPNPSNNQQQQSK